MNKIIYYLAVIFILFGCENNVGEDMPKSNSNGITYFRDTSTGICFAKISSITYYGYYISSISCVPCDSLKKIGLK